MAAIDTLLSRLDGVRSRGDGQYMAKCPSHQDRSPSLSIKECDGGKVMIHCFAGCSALDVVESVGLALRDLFDAPLPDTQVSRPERGRLSAEDLLTILDHSSHFVWTLAENMAAGEIPSDADLSSLAKHRTAIKQARKSFTGRHH